MAQCRRSWNRKPGSPAFFVRVRQADRQLLTCRRRVNAGDVVVDHLLAAEGELGDEGGKDVVRWLNRAKAFCSATQPRQSRNRHVSERNHSFTRSRLGRANRQSAGEQVNVGPLEGFQFAASRGGVQAENRGKVSRFPFRPHYSRFEKPLLFFLGECPPDGARLFEGPYIVSNTRPEPRSLQDAAQDAQFCVERCRASTRTSARGAPLRFLVCCSRSGTR